MARSTRRRRRATRPWRRSGSMSCRRSRFRRAACGRGARLGLAGHEDLAVRRHRPRALDVGDEAADLLRRSRSADWKNGGVEDDAQHVVGHAVDAEVAARAAGQSAGEHLGDDAQAIPFVSAEGKDRAGRRGVKRLRDRWSDCPRRRGCSRRGPFTPLLNATLILPSAIVQVEMSRMIGGPFLTGTPAAIGLAESRRWLPPNGATRMPPPLVLTKWSETLPAWAAISAQSPMRPRWPEFRKRHHGHALAPGLVDAQLRRLLRPSPGRSRIARRPPPAHRSRSTIASDLIRQHLARAQPVDINRDADDPVRVVADQVGLHQVMGDPLVLGRPAAGGGEDVADDSFEAVVGDDQVNHCV